MNHLQTLVLSCLSEQVHSSLFGYRTLMGMRDRHNYIVLELHIICAEETATSLASAEESAQSFLIFLIIMLFSCLISLIFFTEAAVCILLPFISLKSKYPEVLLPYTKHSFPSYLTLSNLAKPNTKCSDWFFFNFPPFRILSLYIFLLCLLTWNPLNI